MQRPALSGWPEVSECVQGILTLPANFARLGWAVALGVILLSGLALAYQGSLFGRVAAKFPDKCTFVDLAKAAIGPKGRYLVWSTAYVAGTLGPASYIPAPLIFLL